MTGSEKTLQGRTVSVQLINEVHRVAEELSSELHKSYAIKRLRSGVLNHERSDLLRYS